VVDDPGVVISTESSLCCGLWEAARETVSVVDDPGGVISIESSFCSTRGKISESFSLGFFLAFFDFGILSLKNKDFGDEVCLK
jgi:hypothetical protein